MSTLPPLPTDADPAETPDNSRWQLMRALDEPVATTPVAVKEVAPDHGPDPVNEGALRQHHGMSTEMKLAVLITVTVIAVSTISGCCEYTLTRV